MRVICIANYNVKVPVQKYGWPSIRGIELSKYPASFYERKEYNAIISCTPSNASMSWFHITVYDGSTDCNGWDIGTRFSTVSTFMRYFRLV